MSLLTAARTLKSNDATEREQAMGTLLEARTAAIAPLMDAMAEPGAAVGRIALMLSALGARTAIDAIIDATRQQTPGSEELVNLTQALAELVSPEDAAADKRQQAIVGLSEHLDARIRGFAAAALGTIGSEAAQARLHVMAASDAQATVQKAALEALVALKEAGRLKPTNGFSSKPPTTGDEGSDHASAVARTSASSTSQDIEEGGLAVDLEALVSAQSAAQPDTAATDAEGAPMASLEELVAQANAAGGYLQPHLEQLGAMRWADRNTAIEALVAAGKKAVPHLVNALTDTNVKMRMGACLALMGLQAPEAAYPLMLCATSPAKTDEETELRGIALKALANCLTGAEEGLAEPLVPLARDKDRWVRAGALLCLGRLADRVGIRVAVLALDDPDSIVRDAAAVAVSEGARGEDEDLVLPLLAILGGFPSPSAEVKEAILIALSRIRVHDDAIKVRVRRRVRRSVLGQTSSMRRTAISVLEQAFGDGDPPPVNVLDDVLSRLDDDHPEVRIVAASFVSRYLEPGMTGAIGPLLDAIVHHETTVGLLCLEALKRHDTLQAKEALSTLSTSTDEDIAQRAQALVHDFNPNTPLWELHPEPARRTAPSKAPDHASSNEPPDVAPAETPRRRADNARVPASNNDAHDNRSSASRVRQATTADVVAAVIPDTPPDFVDNPALSLSKRLMAVKDASGSGRLSVSKAKAARAAVLEAFADEPGERALTDDQLEDDLQTSAAALDQLTEAFEADLLAEDEFVDLQNLIFTDS